MQLQAQTEHLGTQLSQCEDRAQAERGARQQAEKRVTHFENQLTSTRREIGSLQHEKNYLFSFNKRLTKRMHQRERDIKKALSALSTLEPETENRTPVKLFCSVCHDILRLSAVT